MQISTNSVGTHSFFPRIFDKLIVSYPAVILPSVRYGILIETQFFVELKAKNWYLRVENSYKLVHLNFDLSTSLIDGL